MRPSIRSLFGVLVIVSALGLSPASSPAVTFEFTARVTSIDTVIFPGVSIGDIVSGSYSFNPATPDNFPANSLFGIYRDTSGTFDLQVGATLVTMTPLVPGDSLSITIDVGGGPFLFSYVVFADRIKGLGGPIGAGIFLDASTNVVGSDQLSATPPDPSLFDERRQVFVTLIDDRNILEGELLSLTRRVPSPCSLVLALLALPGLLWWTRRARYLRSCQSA